MNKYTLIFPIFLIVVGLAQSPTIVNAESDWQWSVIDVLSTDSTLASEYPVIASDPQGNIHVVWADNTNYSNSGTDKDIFYKKLDVVTQIWSTTEVISTDSTANSDYPSIISDYLGIIHVVWQDDTNYSNSGTDQDIFYKKLDGQIWSTTEVVTTESLGTAGNPSIACDSIGNVHVTWRDRTTFENDEFDEDIAYKKLDVSTQTWSIAELLSTESTDQSYFPSIAIDNNDNIHITWLDTTDYNGAGGGDYDIFYKKWDHRSLSWGTTGVISKESTWDSNSPDVAFDSMNNIYITWYDLTDYDGSGIDRDIFFKMWDHSSESWGITEVISTESEGASYAPVISIDSEDEIHVIWFDISNYDNSGDGDYDIFYKHKARDASWDSSTNILSPNSGDSMYPAITIDNSQFIHIIWQDDTNYTNAGLDRDIFYTKLSGLPQAPVLDAIHPNPSNGIISLEWDDVFSAGQYKIYRDIYPINSIDGLVAIASTSASYYVDELVDGGTYYYAISAINPEGYTLSNTEYVQVDLDTIENFTVTEEITKTETSNIEDILTVTGTDGGFVDFPVSVPMIFVSFTLIMVIQRRKR